MELRQLKRAVKELKTYVVKFPMRIAYQIKFGDMCKNVGEADLAIKTYLRFIFSILGTSRVDTTAIRATYQIGVTPSLSHAEIVEFLSDVYFAVRQLIDLFLDTRNRGVIAMIVRLCTETVSEIRAFLPPDSNIAEIPMDIAMLYAIYQIRLRSDPSIAEGLSILNPILLQVERAEDESDLNSSSNGGVEQKETDECGGNLNDDNVSITYSVNTMFSNINNMRMSYDQEAPAEDFEETSKYENNLFFLRQRVRVCEEFCAVGVKTRAMKLLSRVTSQLAKVVPREALVQSSKDNEVISLMWCKIGQVYESLKDAENANSSYIKALIGNNKSVYILRSYSTFLMNNLAVESFFAVQCLQSHFDTLMENIQRSTDIAHNIPDDKNLGILGVEGMGEVENLGTGELPIRGALSGPEKKNLPKMNTLVTSSLNKLRSAAETGESLQLSMLQDSRYLDSLLNSAPADPSSQGDNTTDVHNLTEVGQTGFNPEDEEEEVDLDGDVAVGKEDGEDNLSDLDVENDNLDDPDGGDAGLAGAEGVSASKDSLMRYTTESLESEMISLASWAVLQLHTKKRGISTEDSSSKGLNFCSFEWRIHFLIYSFALL